MHDFKNLKVWKKAVKLATEVYGITKAYPDIERYGLVSQINRSVVSVGSNIAEGAGRSTNAEFKYFLNIAYGSTYELETQIIISHNLNYLKTQELENLTDQIIEIQKMLYVLIKKLNPGK